MVRNVVEICPFCGEKLLYVYAYRAEGVYICENCDARINGENLPEMEKREWKENLNSGEAMRSNEGKMKEEIEEMEIKIQELEYELILLQQKKKKEKKIPELRLEVNSIVNALCIKFGENLIGFITSDGRCKILKTESFKDDFLRWDKSGRYIDESSVMWNGGEYFIDFLGTLGRVDILEGNIYNFNHASPCRGCTDPNIVVYDFNKTPKLF